MKMALLVTLFFGGFMASAQTTPGEIFCHELEKNAPAQPDDQTLHYIHAKLLDAKVISEPEFKTKSALEAGARLQKEGFYDVLKKKKAVLKNEELIPTGAIFVLKKAGNCPVDPKEGHLAIKCAPDRLYWVARQNKNLTQFLKENSKCIQSILFHPKWGALPEPTPTPTPK